MEFKDLNLLEIGNDVQITGMVLSRGADVHYIAPFPNEITDGVVLQLEMSQTDWEEFLNQSDVQNVAVVGGPNKKAVIRKSQRQIDANISWKVYLRDGYHCRYCGKGGIPLTVDHIVLWEEGGPTVEDNLMSACRKCNRTRGSMEYTDWLRSREYQLISKDLTTVERLANARIVDMLPELEDKKLSYVRTR